MEVADLIIEVVAVSASGVLAPGPLFIANVLQGVRQGARAGLKIAFGHSVVELSLVSILAAGLVASFAILQAYLDAISIVGGTAILGFAAFQLLNISKIKNRPTTSATGTRGPFITGIILSALNPFFLIWWFTVGLKIISDSMSFGLLLGVVLVFGFHIWMDYAWLVGTAYLSSRGSSLLNSRYYMILVLVLNAILAYFGVNFIISALA
jgi:threonine/homoserine/homoserine lactone efflux protein